jgi:hypothetical protein
MTPAVGALSTVLDAACTRAGAENVVTTRFSTAGIVTMSWANAR